MRKMIFALLSMLMLAPMVSHSQNAMTVSLKNGSHGYFAFKAKPVISFTDTDVVFATSDGVSVTYPLADLIKFTFETVDPTEVEGIKDDVKKVVLSIDEYSITISGAKAEEQVQLIGTDGKVLGTYKTDDNGSVQFSVAELPEGSYIVSSQEVSAKILKK